MVGDLTGWISGVTDESTGLRNSLSGWCLDQEYPGGTESPGTKVVGAWQCNGGANQRWHWEWTAGNKVRLVNSLSGLCLDQEYPEGPDKPATRVVGAWRCNGGANQEWHVRQIESDRRVQMINALSGWCLDQEYPDGTDKPGTHIVASWNCNGGANQKWVVF